MNLHNPDIGPILFDDDGVELDDIFQYIIHSSIVSIGVIVIVTMYQVMISVRTIMGLTSASQAKKQKFVVYTLASIFTSIALSAIAFVPIQFTEDVKKILIAGYILISVYAILTISYSISIALLYRTLV